MPSSALRRPAIAKRVSLEGVNEGWTDECYALINPPDYLDTIAIKQQKIDAKDEVASIQVMMDFVKNHFVSGKIMVYNDKDELELADMAAEDVNATRELTDRLYLAAMGVAYDPKGLSTAKETSSTTEPSSEPS